MSFTFYLLEYEILESLWHFKQLKIASKDNEKMAGDFSPSEGKILNAKKLTILIPTWVDRIKQKSIVISTDSCHVPYTILWSQKVPEDQELTNKTKKLLSYSFNNSTSMNDERIKCKGNTTAERTSRWTIL